MKQFLAAVVIALSLAPMGALAQERVGDAALGGLSGAIVLGPVGAVAGIVVGYAAGPAIRRSWGLRRSAPRYQGQTTKPPPVAPSSNAALKQVAAQNVAAAAPMPVSGTKRTWASPPVLGFE
jgi:outer membrane lipoprotein SlyB